MTRLVLLCAASTAALRAGAFPTDEPLDAKGRAALTRLAGQFQSDGRVLASPALSAAQTAEGLGLRAAPEPALRDCDFGRWAGRALSEVEARESGALALWLGDPRAAPHGGESFAEVSHRVGAWMDALPRNCNVLAIAHAAVLRAAIVHALGAPPQSLLCIDVGPLSQACFSDGCGGWRLRALAPLKDSRCQTSEIGWRAEQ